MPLLPAVCLLMSHGTAYLYDRLKPVFGNAARYALIFFILFILVRNFSKITEHIFYADEPYREVAGLIYDNEAKQSGIGTAAILATESDFVYEGWKELYFSDKQDKTLPAYNLQPLKYSAVYDDEIRDRIPLIAESLREAKYDRIYLCYLHSPLDRRQAWQPILDWLHENYRFSGKVNDYNFEILTRKQ